MDFIFETARRVEFIIEICACIISSFLLVMYYGKFLTTKGKRAHITLLGFGIIYLLSKYLLGLVDVNETYLQFIKITANAAIIFALSFVFFKRDLNKKVFLLASFISVQEICLFLAISVGRLFSNIWIMALNIEQQTFAYLKALVIINPIFHITVFTITAILSLNSIVKSFIYKNYRMKKVELFILVLPCITTLLITSIIRIIILKPDGSGFDIYANNVSIQILVFITAAFLLISMVYSVQLFQKAVKGLIEEKNMLVFQKQAQQLQNQVRDMDTIYDEIKSMRHDMRSHIAGINFIINKGGNYNDELSGYLEKLEGALNRFEFAFKTGNSISDIIINQKFQEAQDYNINFSSDFIYPTRLHLDSYDLAVILNNALENAIEACKNAREKGFIKIYSYAKGEMFFIEIENNHSNNIVFKDNGLPISNKVDEDTHGIGLSNVSRCAQKYFGAIDIQSIEKGTDKIFKLTIMLQGRE